jgi:predicted small secreted protein
MRKTWITTLVALLCLAMLGAALGCETVKGMGRDIENLGEELQK